MSDKYKPDRPVFCGNFEYDASLREVEKLFERYGPVERVDMKTGFAFVYMKDKRDGDDAVHELDGKEFGYRRRKLKVEWAKGNGEVKKREELRKRQARPTTTLFVVNFDPDRTRDRDLERIFDRFGRLVRVQIKRNYAFIQYEHVEDAARALEETSGTRLDGRVLTVEFVARENNESWGGSDRGGRYRSRSRSRSPGYRRRSRSPRKSRSRSPRRSRSRSPAPRRSPSPGRRTRSPSPAHDGDRKGASASPPPKHSRSRSRSRGRSPPPASRSRSASPRSP